MRHLINLGDSKRGELLQKGTVGVRAHFRWDPRAKRFVYIPPHSAHRPEFSFAPGEQIKITGGKYDGQTAKLVGNYSKKYHEVGAVLDDGRRILIKPERFTVINSTAPVDPLSQVKRVVVQAQAAQQNLPPTAAPVAPGLTTGADKDGSLVLEPPDPADKLDRQAVSVSSEYDFDGMFKAFSEQTDLKIDFWDKFAGKGFVRYYFKKDGKDIGYIEVGAKTKGPRTISLNMPKGVGAVRDEAISPTGVGTFYKELCRKWRASRGEDMTGVRAFLDSGLLLAHHSDGSASIRGNTYPNKEVLSGMGGVWDNTLKAYVWSAKALDDNPLALAHVLESIPPFYTREDIFGYDRGQGEKSYISTAGGTGQPADTQRVSAPSGNALGHEKPADPRRDTASGAAGGNSPGRDESTEGKKGAVRRVIVQTPQEQLRSKTFQELADMVYGNKVQPPPAEDRLPEQIKKDLTLFPHQVSGANQILQAYVNGASGFLLADGTGTGKTYTAAAALAALKPKKGLIIVPSKGVAKQWADVLAAAGVEIDPAEKGPSKKDGVRLMTYAAFNKCPDSHKVGWDAIVFDEAHNLKNLAEAELEGPGAGATAKKAYAMLAARRRGGSKILYCTATPYEKLQQAKAYEALGLWDKTGFESWLYARGVRLKEYRTKSGVTIRQYVFTDNTGDTALKESLITHIEAVKSGVYLRRQVMPEGVKLSNNFKTHGLTQEQKIEYERVRDMFFELADEFDNSPYKAVVMAQAKLWSRRYLESVKIPLAIETAQAELAKGRSVAIMTGYKGASDASQFIEGLEGKAAAKGYGSMGIFRRLREELDKKGVEIEGTMATLRKAFPEAVEYHGDMTAKQREQAKNDFNAGKAKIIIATQASAGTGLSLHDVLGDFPRSQVNTTLPWTAQDMEQVAGRTYRLGSKSDTEMHWLFSDMPEEQRRAEVVALRMSILGAGTDGIDVKQDNETYRNLVRFSSGDADIGDGFGKMVKSLLLLVSLG